MADTTMTTPGGAFKERLAGLDDDGRIRAIAEAVYERTRSGPPTDPTTKIRIMRVSRLRRLHWAIAGLVALQAVTTVALVAALVDVI